jgi:hypothetical protein
VGEARVVTDGLYCWNCQTIASRLLTDLHHCPVCRAECCSAAGEMAALLGAQQLRTERVHVRRTA